MRDHTKEKIVAIAAVLILFTVLFGTLFSIGLSYASSAAVNIVANVQVTGACTLSLSNSVINIGSLNPGTSLAPQNAVTDTNGGNSNSYLWLYGSNWILIGAVTPNFYVTNTIFSNAIGSSGEGAGYLFNALTIASANSGMLVGITPADTNTLFFSVNVPAGQPAASYSSNIAIFNNC